MTCDIFGDLQEWGDVLEMLAGIRAANDLDQHQTGLARLIRCRDNWRLREEALIAAADVRKPRSSLVAATLKLLADDDEALENRILAARALGSMLSSYQSHPGDEVDVEAALARMEDLTGNGGPPVLHAAIRGACTQAAPSRR